jgi:hypothetical protein
MTRTEDSDQEMWKSIDLTLRDNKQALWYAGIKIKKPQASNRRLPGHSMS